MVVLCFCWGFFFVVNCMAHGVVGWRKPRQGRQVREAGKSDTRQEAECVCQCLFPSPRLSQPCSAPGQGQAGGSDWGARLGPSCPAALSCPRALWGCAGPGLLQVLWCSWHSPFVPAGTAGPYWPKPAERSIVPRRPPQVPAGPELVAGQAGLVPQTLWAEAVLASPWVVDIAGAATGCLQRCHLACGSLVGQHGECGPTGVPIPPAGPMPQEPCPAVARGAPAPHTSPQSPGHPEGSRGAAWAGRHQGSPGSCGCRHWAGGPGRGWPPPSPPGWAASGWQDPAPSAPSRLPPTATRAAPAPRPGPHAAGRAPARAAVLPPPRAAPRRPCCSPGTSPASGCSRCSHACPSWPWSGRRCPTWGWRRSRCCPGAAAPPPWTAPRRCWAGARRWRPWSPRRSRPRGLRCLQGQSTEEAESPAGSGYREFMGKGLYLQLCTQSHWKHILQYTAPL